jgi:hypothetical protein
MSFIESHCIVVDGMSDDGTRTGRIGRYKAAT